MNREEAMPRKRPIKSIVNPKICLNDSCSQSGFNQLEGQQREHALNPERPTSNYFLTNWCRRFFCMRQVNQEADEDEIIIYTASKSKP